MTARCKTVKVWTWRRMLRDHGPENPGTLLTLHTLASFMDNDGSCYPGQDAVARGARVSARTVKRHIADAVALGWLHVETVSLPHKGKGWRRNEYRAVVPAGLPLEETDEALMDVLHSQSGDVEHGEGGDTAMAPRIEGGDTILSPRYEQARSGERAKVGTSGAFRGDTSGEGGDTGRQIVGTQLWPHNSSVNSSLKLLSEGAADTAPREDVTEKGREQKSATATNGSPMSRRASTPSRSLTESEILNLVGTGMKPERIATMYGIPIADVEAIVEAAS